MPRLTFGSAKLQVKEFIQNFVGYNKMSEGKSFVVSDETIDDMLNEAYQVFAVKARIHKDYFWLQMIKDTQTYTLPHDTAQLIQVSYMSGTSAWEIREIHERDISAWRSLDGAPSGYYPLYTKKQIQVWPIPKYTGEWLRGYAVFCPDHIDDDAAAFEIPAEYEHAIPHYVFAHMIYKMTALMPEKIGNQAMQSAKKYESNFDEWAEDCRSVIEDKANCDYQFALDDGSESHESDALVSYANKEARFTSLYFDPASGIELYSAKSAGRLLSFDKNRIYWNDALFYGVDKNLISTDDETFIFKSRRKSVFRLRIYVKRDIGGAAAYAYHGCSYNVTEFSNGVILFSQLSDNDNSVVPIIVTVSAAANKQDISIRVQNARRGEITIVGRFQGVCF